MTLGKFLNLPELQLLLKEGILMFLTIAEGLITVCLPLGKVLVSYPACFTVCVVYCGCQMK